MRKFILITVLSFFIGSSYAQHFHPDGLSCSRAKFYKEYFKSSKDIIQTPLLHDYDVKFYFLDIEVDNSSTFVSGDVTIHSEVVVAELDTFAFELLSAMTIEQVMINNVQQNFIHENDEAFVILDNPILEEEVFTAKVSYYGTPPTGGFFSGITNATDWGKQVTWTLSEPFAARDWWPTKQVLEGAVESGFRTPAGAFGSSFIDQFDKYKLTEVND